MQNFDTIMENTVKERLIKYLEEKRISKSEFGRAIGVSSAYVSSIRESISPDKIQSIALNYPDLNIQWLLTGDGPMILMPGWRSSHDAPSESEQDVISAGQLMAYVQENQRQMGQLIDTIATLTSKLA